MEMSLFKKQDIRKYMRMRMAFVAVVERETDGFCAHFQKISWEAVGCTGVERGGCRYSQSSTGRRKIDSGTEVEGEQKIRRGREVVKVSELKVES